MSIDLFYKDSKDWHIHADKYFNCAEDVSKAFSLKGKTTQGLIIINRAELIILYSIFNC